MNLLSDDFLLEAYFKAVEQKLDPLFIEILKNEICKRGLLQDGLKIS